MAKHHDCRTRDPPPEPSTANSAGVRATLVSSEAKASRREGASGATPGDPKALDGRPPLPIEIP